MKGTRIQSICVNTPYSLTHEVLCKVTKNCSRFWIPAFAGMTEGGVLHDCRHSRESGNPEVWFRLRRVRGTSVSSYYEGYESVAPAITATYTGDMIGVLDLSANSGSWFVHRKALLSYSIATNQVTAKFRGIKPISSDVDLGFRDFEVGPVSVGEGGAFSNMGPSYEDCLGGGCVESGFYGRGAFEAAGRAVKVYENAI